MLIAAHVADDPFHDQVSRLALQRLHGTVYVILLAAANHDLGAILCQPSGNTQANPDTKITQQANCGMIARSTYPDVDPVTMATFPSSRRLAAISVSGRLTYRKNFTCKVKEGTG